MADLSSDISQDTIEVLQNAVGGSIGGQQVRFVCLADLLRAKREADRPKDRLDLTEREALQSRAPGR